MQLKIDRSLSDILLCEEDGIDDAETLVIAYGAAARTARHAVELARTVKGVSRVQSKLTVVSR